MGVCGAPYPLPSDKVTHSLHGGWTMFLEFSRLHGPYEQKFEFNVDNHAFSDSVFGLVSSGFSCDIIQ